jgi:hypothetical protein
MAMVDTSADDFLKEPWLYPGAPVRSGLLVDGELLGTSSLDHLDSALLRSNSAGVDDRALVVAVGSNASPAVMHRKFSLAQVSTVVPFVKATVAGIGVGHSAHVGKPGYVPAAPFLAPIATTSVVAALLDASQMKTLDDTELNYVRAGLSSGEFGLRFESGEVPESFSIYVSRWGLVRGEAEDPLPISSQSDVFAHLRRRSAAFARFASTDGTETVMRRLAAGAQHREDLRHAWAEEELVAESGLGNDSRGADQPGGGWRSSP